ncbi:MAG TPA: zinc-dependent peptidase [Gemmataceae bacterium]|jgi:hypothetical protein
MEHHPTPESETVAQPLAESLRQSFRGKTALTIRDTISSAHAGVSSFSDCALDFRAPPDEPFPETWLTYLRENVFLYHLLSDACQARLRRAVRRFIADKFWEGCAGLRISEEMQVTIAGQACLLVLGFAGYCFEDHKTVLVYPSGYLGIDPEEPVVGPSHRLGEAHWRGPVVLSWWHAHWGGRYWYGNNVVLHEFAHKLAEMGDPRAGIPPFDDSRWAERWKAVMTAEHRQLIEDADYRRPTVLSLYGATNPTEFFAVASECFFLRPLALSQRHPILYQLLAEWYRQDPAEWRIDEEAAAQVEDAEEEDLRHTLIECDAILDRFPDYLNAYRRRAACWSALGEFDNALADCTRLVELVAKREKAAAYSERGWIHYQSGAHQRAIEDFSEAIRRSSDLAEAYCGRGTVYAVRGEYGRAIADLTRTLQLDPKDDAALLWRAYIRCETGKYDKALRDLQNAIRLCPHRADGYRERGIVYLRKKDYERAIADLSTAMCLDPDDADAYAARAEAFEAQGKTTEAERDRAKAEQTGAERCARQSPHQDGILGADGRV